MAKLQIIIADEDDEVVVHCEGDTQGERTPAWTLANKLMESVEAALSKATDGVS